MRFMGIRDLFTSKNQPIPQLLVRQIDEREREEIESMLDDGYKPSEIAAHFGDEYTRAIGTISRERRRGISAREFVPPSRSVSPRSPHPLSADPEEERLRREIEKERLRDELARVRSENEHNRKIRELELKKLQLEVQQKEEELYGDDEDDDQFGQGWEQYAQNPEIAMWNFFSKIAEKGGKRDAPPTVEAQVVQGPDVTKPLPKETIHEILSRVDPGDLAQARAAPAWMVVQGLKTRYPGITEDNIKRVMHEIRHYGNQAEPGQDDDELLQDGSRAETSRGSEGSSVGGKVRRPRRAASGKHEPSEGDGGDDVRSRQSQQRLGDDQV